MRRISFTLGALGIAVGLISSFAFAATPIVVQARQNGPKLTENEAFDRCVASINMIGKRPVDTEMPNVPSQQDGGEKIFKWKTQSGFINCRISDEKRGRLTVFSSKQ